MKSKFEGKGGISAQIVADSVSAVNGQRITTMELVYHRFIHGELMSHRQFSRNAMSSRAIPVERMLELVETTPAAPIHWGAKQAGMQADNECDNPVKSLYNKLRHNEDNFVSREIAWKTASDLARLSALYLSEAGYHKQVVNRLLESFQMMKTLVTFTESDNFFHLRNHKDAEPHIQELARVMYEAMQDSEPEVLQVGEWHTPYVDHLRTEDGLQYIIYDEVVGAGTTGFYVTPEEALKISSSCAAQISYRRNDQSLEKALDIYAKLVDSEPVHASAFEHAATPIVAGQLHGNSAFDMFNMSFEPRSWQDGVTHSDKQGSLWSGNFKSWIQYRQLIPNNVYNGETK